MTTVAHNIYKFTAFMIWWRGKKQNEVFLLIWWSFMFYSSRKQKNSTKIYTLCKSRFLNKKKSILKYRAKKWAHYSVGHLVSVTINSGEIDLIVHHVGIHICWIWYIFFFNFVWIELVKINSLLFYAMRIYSLSSRLHGNKIQA